MFTNIDTQKKFEKDLSLPQIIMRSFSYYNIFKNSPKVNCLKRLDKHFEISELWCIRFNVLRTEMHTKIKKEIENNRISGYYN